MRSVAALLLAATVAALTGCSAPTEPPPAASPSATGTPVFASDDEALAAAEKAYNEYLAMSDQIASEGGERPERIEAFVTPERLEADLAGFQAYREQGLKTRGVTRFESYGLQQQWGDAFSGATVVIYGCWDARDVTVETLEGSDATPDDRQERLPLEVTLVSDDSEARRLVVHEEAQWSGDSVC